MLIHDFSDNTIRKLKTDRADALKVANYALTFWDTLPPFNNEEETRLLLKMQSRANERITATATALRNGLIALADQTFPGVNIAFDPNTKKCKWAWKVGGLLSALLAQGLCLSIFHGGFHGILSGMVQTKKLQVPYRYRSPNLSACTGGRGYSSEMRKYEDIDLNDYILVTGYKLWVQNGLSRRLPIEGIFFQDHFQLQALPLLQSSTLHRSPRRPTLF